MASSIFLASSTLSLILLHFLFLTQPGHSIRIHNQTRQSGFRVTLTHLDSSKKWSPNPHHASLHDATDDVLTTPMAALKDEYVMSLAIGTPPVPFSAIMDTGSDLIWTDKCNPSYSSSFSTVNDSTCDTYGLSGCQQKYEDGTSVTFTLAHETFTIGEAKFDNKIFGCVKPDNKKKNYNGVVGMGRGKLSLVSQFNEQVFAYCMSSRLGKSKSVLLTGSIANSALAKGNIQTMPLLKNNAEGYESFYYIPLEGISVGKTRLPVTKSDFGISNYGGGGMIIDSGTTFTYLEQSIIDMIESAIVNQTNLKKGAGKPTHQYKHELKHCFEFPIDPKMIMPKMVFHFEGADWELPTENYMYDGCLGFIASQKQESVFGNLQQQNMLVFYDIGKNSLSFRPAMCNAL